jgi:hypothetical protein
MQIQYCLPAALMGALGFLVSAIKECGAACRVCGRAATCVYVYTAMSLIGLLFSPVSIWLGFCLFSRRKELQIWKASVQTQKQAADAGVVLGVAGKARPVVWMQLLVIALGGAPAISSR